MDVYISTTHGGSDVTVTLVVKTFEVAGDEVADLHVELCLGLTESS